MGDFENHLPSLQQENSAPSPAANMNTWALPSNLYTVPSVRQAVPAAEVGRPLTDREKLIAANTLATFKFDGTLPIFDVTIFTLIRGRTSDVDGEIPNYEENSAIDGQGANALEVPPTFVPPYQAEAQYNPLPNDAYPQEAFSPGPNPYRYNPALNTSTMPPQPFQEFLQEMPLTSVSSYHMEAQNNPLPYDAYQQEAFPPDPIPYPYNPALNIMPPQPFQEFLQDHTAVLPNPTRAQPVPLSHDIFQQNAFSPQPIPYPGSNPAWNVVPPPSLPQFFRDSSAAYFTQASKSYPVPNPFTFRGSLSPPTSQLSPGSSTSSSASSSESSLGKRPRDALEDDDVGTPASDEPFICKWDGCHAKISYVPNSDAGGVPEVVRSHIKAHFPIVPKDTQARCRWESCNKTMNRDNLRKHILVHLPLFHYRCRGCSTSYQRSEKWFAHVAKCTRYQVYHNSRGKARPVKRLKKTTRKMNTRCNST